jgi:hypothetical protein
MSKILSQPRINDCAGAAQSGKNKKRTNKNYLESFAFDQDPAVECLIRNLDHAKPEHVLMTFHSAKNIYSLKHLFTKYENDKFAVQEGERVVMGLWGHWADNSEMKKLYNPHPITIMLIKSIRGDEIAFLRICMKKYSSTLKSSVCNPKLPKVYNVSEKSLANICTTCIEDQEESEVDVFDRSIVKISKINRKTKHVQLGFSFEIFD